MIDLNSGALRATISTTDGGSIVGLHGNVRGTWRPILQSDPTQGDTPLALSSGLFTMLPFANRAAENLLWAADQSFDVLPNMPDPLALHGTGWERTWQVLDHAAQSLRLGLQIDASTYPFAFDAVLTFSLSETTLRLGCRVTNTDHRDIPAGIGFHPYFPRSSTTRLRFLAKRFWLEGPDHLPTSPISIPPELDFSQGAEVPETWRNNVYSGWSGQAEIQQPDLGYRLILEASETLRELMLYIPQNATRFALEPQSHTSGLTRTSDIPPDAVGLRRLAPGESLDGTLTMTFQPL